jgi:hypothetical protein
MALQRTSVFVSSGIRYQRLLTFGSVIPSSGEQDVRLRLYGTLTRLCLGGFGTLGLTKKLWLGLLGGADPIC